MTAYIDNQVVEGNLQHKSWNTGVLATVVSATTLVLTSGSESTQIFTGSTSGQILKLPDATTYSQIGARYTIHNDSGQNLTVNDNSSALLILLGASQRALLICSGIGSAAGTWSYIILDKNSSTLNQLFVTYPGTGLAVNYTGGVSRVNGTTTLITAGTITLTASVTGGWVYVDIDGVVKQSASLPSGAVAMALFTTSASAVTSLQDEREVIDDNTNWGVVADIVAETYNRAASAGVLEKSARADHAHANNALLNRAGIVVAASFTGSPRTFAVVFTTPMPSAAYGIKITGQDARLFTYSARTVNGFTISANANQALTADVSWEATITGEAS
jgi:hypothetical protein